MLHSARRSRGTVQDAAECSMTVQSANGLSEDTSAMLHAGSVIVATASIFAWSASGVDSFSPTSVPLLHAGCLFEGDGQCFARAVSRLHADSVRQECQSSGVSSFGTCDNLWW